MAGHKGIFEKVFTGQIRILLEFLSYHVEDGEALLRWYCGRFVAFCEEGSV